MAETLLKHLALNGSLVQLQNRALTKIKLIERMVT